MKEKIAAISIGVNLLLAGAKIAAGVFSRSAAVAAEGAHSFVDVFASAVGYWGIKISQKPADKKHPYGYYKFEVLAGAAITLILLATGAGIVWEAIQKLSTPQKAEIGYWAFAAMLFSAAANEIMARIKIHFGKKENSISLLSDGVHSRVDVFASLGVFAGLFLVEYWIYADAVLALLIGVYIIKESFSLGKEAADSLLDVSAGREIEGKIADLAKEMNVDIDSLTTQKKGAAAAANLAINLPKDLKVEAAARIAEELRKKLTGKIKNLAFVAIQIKSHQIETGFYKSAFGKGMGWRQAGRFKKDIEGAAGFGPAGECFCQKCGYETAHERGIPCSNLNCPDCKINLQRK